MNDEDHTPPIAIEPSAKPWRARIKIPFGLTERASGLAFLGLIAALVGLTGFAAWANIQEGGWNSDAAAWAQAAGSIIAIAGAAWLARGEARQARRWRRAQGEEAAWSVRFAIAQAQLDAQIIAAELGQPEEKPDATTMRSWRQRAANASLGLQTMLGKVDHIHPAVVLSTCNAKILIDGLSSDLDKLEQAFASGPEPDSELVEDIINVHVNLVVLLDHFDARVRGIKEALDRGGDMLPLREWVK